MIVMITIICIINMILLFGIISHILKIIEPSKKENLSSKILGMESKEIKNYE